MKVPFLQPHSTSAVPLFGGWVPAHSSGFYSQHCYQSGWLNLESRLVTERQLWWHHTIYGNTSWALWLPLDVQVGHWQGTAPHPTTGTSPERVWLLSAHTCPFTCIPGLKEQIPARPRLWDLHLNQWEKPLTVQSTELNFYTYSVLQQG